MLGKLHIAVLTAVASLVSASEPTGSRNLLNTESALQAFVDRCESAYVMALLEKNLTVKPDLVAMLLFGTLDQSTRVERLTKLARQALSGEPQTRGSGSLSGEWSSR